jgi:hypothetical protein
MEGAGIFESDFDKVVDLSERWALSEFDTARARLVPQQNKKPPRRGGFLLQ